MILYNELAKHYFDIELPNRNFKQEIASLAEIFRRNRTRRILDIGCGSGEHVAELARHGFQVEGADSSERMVQLARKRFPEHTFHIADMKELKLKTNYDAAFCIFGSFNYLIDDADINQALQSTWFTLNPNGILILEVWNSRPLKKIGSKPISPTSSVVSHGQKIARDRGFALQSIHPCLVRVNYLYNLPEQELSDHHTMRCFEYDEILEFVRNSDFEAEMIYSDWEGNLNRERGSRFLLHLRKKVN